MLILQHPREHHKAVNTARIAALALEQAELVVGVDFAHSRELNAALSNPERPAILLYPGPDARDLAEDPPVGPVTLIVIDGTWHQARTLMRANPQLATLPRYAFQPKAPSEYRIRREPRPDYVSTIEALACALPLLEGDEPRFLKLLDPFRAMVDVQVDYAARSSGGRRRERRRNHQSAAARLPELLLSPSLVCVSGEANAWPYDRHHAETPPHPHELVQWVAHRLPSGDEDGARFERIAKPRGPLAPSPVIHGRIPAERLADGVGVDAVVRDYAAFARDEDVVCAWGIYAVDLFVRERGSSFTRFVDVRKVVGDFLKQRPGSIESLVKERGLAFEPLGTGRAGERLGMLVAVTRWLCDEARRERPTAREPECLQTTVSTP